MNPNTAKKASQEDWHPADVIAALHKKDWTLKALAAHHGLKCSTSLSATFTRSLPLNEQRIADALGVHPKEIWPSRYFENGEKRPRGFNAIKSSARSRIVNGNVQAGA